MSHKEESLPAKALRCRDAMEVVARYHQYFNTDPRPIHPDALRQMKEAVDTLMELKMLPAELAAFLAGYEAVQRESATV